MQNFIRIGETLDYKAPEDVKGGSIVVVGDIIGIPPADIAKDTVGTLYTEKVYALPKDNSVIEQGQRVYVDAGKITGTVNALSAGIAWESAAANAATVQVKINI